MSVANNALVAHQEIGQKAVVRDLGCAVVGRVVAAVHIGDGRLDEQIVDQVVVVRDRVDTDECRSGAILGREPRSLKDYFRELASRSKPSDRAK